MTTGTSIKMEVSNEKDAEYKDTEGSVGEAMDFKNDDNMIDDSESERKMSSNENIEGTTHANDNGNFMDVKEREPNHHESENHNESVDYTYNNNGDDDDEDQYIDELNESIRENDVSIEMTSDERATAISTLVDGQVQDQKEQQPKRIYQRRRTPVLKWKDIEKEMKTIMYDQAIILWYQLEKKRQTIFKGKLTRQRMAQIILVTLNEPPFLDRQRIYTIINKHVKSCDENGTDPTDCTHLQSIPKIFEALDDLQSLDKYGQKYEQERQQKQQKQQQDTRKKRSIYSNDDSDDEDENNYALKSQVQKLGMTKMKSKETVSKKGGALLKHQEKTVKKGMKTYTKTKGPTTITATAAATGVETGVVTKEVKNITLKKAIDLYLAEKDKIVSCTVSSGIPRTLISDIIVALGQPRWLTRNDVYTAIHNYNKKHGISTNSMSALGTFDSTKKDSKVPGMKKATATFSASNTTLVKREKLTSTQKKARLEEAIEIATNNYLMAKKLAHPNVVREGVLTSIIHSAIAHVRLPPNFSVLITPISIRTRVTAIESNLSKPEMAIMTKQSATTAVIATSTKLETNTHGPANNITTPSNVAKLIGDVNSTIITVKGPAATAPSLATSFSVPSDSTSTGNHTGNETNFF